MNPINVLIFVMGWLALYGFVFYVAWLLAKWAEGKK